MFVSETGLRERRLDDERERAACDRPTLVERYLPTLWLRWRLSSSP
jgi:hypothetical protein